MIKTNRVAMDIEKIRDLLLFFSVFLLSLYSAYSYPVQWLLL